MSGIAVRLLAALLLTAPADAQGGAGRISGTVRSSASGEGLKSAVVTLRSVDGRPSDSRRVTSGPGGEFGFDGLSAGRYRLMIHKSGFSPISGGSHFVALRKDQKVGNLVFALSPAAAVSGRVRDWEGEPVAEAGVRAYRLSYGPKGAALTEAARAKSDELGRFRLFNLRAGRYLLRVSPPRAGATGALFYANTSGSFYPGVASLSQALPVELQWGDELGDVELTLSGDAGFSVSGAVADAEAEGPCRRCAVRALHMDGSLQLEIPNATPVSGDGSFVIRGLAPGEYKLIATQGRGGGRVGQTDVSIREGDLADVGILVGVTQTVSGSILLDEPPDAIDVTQWTPQLTPAVPSRLWPEARGEIFETLEFSIHDVPPASYEFEIPDLPPGAYLRALRVGGQPSAEPRVTVPAGAAVSGLQAVIGFDGGSLSGQVRASRSASAKTPSEAWVYLIPKQTRKGYTREMRTRTAADGGFRFTSVPPGAYTLYAVPLTSALQVFDPAVQSALRHYARQIDIGPKENATVEWVIVTDQP